MNLKKTIPNELFFASVEEIIGEGGSVEMTVKGFSMRPFIRNERDVVVLSPLGERALQRGMVLLFRYRGAHVLHRLCGMENGRLIMEGDGNYRQREEIDAKDVVAYVSELKLEGGRGLKYASPGWRCRTMMSLRRKGLRTFALDVKRRIKR